jgi:hypothetical protein
VSRPLDPAAAYLYGLFVEAAYRMYGNPSDPDPLRPEPVGIPDGWEVGAWIQMSDFVLQQEVPKFYGIVAHQIANPDSRIIAIRGTEGAIEWLDDAAAVPVPFRQVPSAGRVAAGFDKIYSTLKVLKRHLPAADALAEGAAPQGAPPDTFAGSFADQLEQLAISRETARGAERPGGEGTRPPRPTVVAGHSLGASLATLFAMENASKGRFDISTLCTFASPRVGNMEFVHTFNQLPIDSWRIVNTRDLVPKLPPSVPIFLDYGQVDAEYTFDSAPFAKNNLLCWHVLETYLHWLNPDFPLRAECA